MARNEYGGKCYRCGEWVAPKAGHFERYKGGWRVQHAGCAVAYRGTDKKHEAPVKNTKGVSP